MTPLPPARPASAVPVSPAAPRRIGGRGARGEGRSSSAFIASGVGSDPAPHIRHGKHLLFPTPPAAAMHRGAGAIPGRDPGRVPHYPQLPTYTPQSDLIHTPGIDYQPMPHAVPSSTITSTSTYMPTNAPPSFRTSPAGDFLFTYYSPIAHASRMALLSCQLRRHRRVGLHHHICAQLHLVQHPML